MSSFKEHLRTLPGVAGIVHSAMVLRDEFVKDWAFESFTDVMGPKIKGNMLICAHICSFLKQQLLEMVYKETASRHLKLR